jgi:hypothetical protein
LSQLDLWARELRPGVRRAGLPRQSPPLTPGQRRRLDLGWIDSKRVRRWVYGATEREVLDKLAQLRDAQRQGQNLSARPMAR